MNKTALLLILGLCASVAGCNDTPIGLTDAPARVRVINTTFQTTDDANPLTSAQPRAIDFKFDGSDGSPSMLGIAASSIYPAPSTDPATSYVSVDQGVHEFSANLSAPATPNTSLFSNSQNPPLPLRMRLFFTGQTNYTIIVAGVAPRVGSPPKSMFVIDGFSTEFPLLDDLSAPSRGADGKRMGRLRLVNAAVFANGGTIVGSPTASLYFTQGPTPIATELTPIFPIARAEYRLQRFSSFLPYSHVPAGQYTATVAVLVNNVRTILAQQPVTITGGEVYTFLLQSTQYAPTPSAANHKLSVIVDAKYSAD